MEKKVLVVGKKEDTAFDMAVKSLEEKKTQVGQMRDEIEEVISELESLRDDCNEAWDSLQDAVDALSRVV